MKEDCHHRYSRRAFIQATAATMLLGGCSVKPEGQPDEKFIPTLTAEQKKLRRQGDSVVALARCESYDENLLAKLKEMSVQANLPDLKNKTVVIKPNMVEFRPDRPVTTNAAMVRAACEFADYLGAKEVIVAEGPGHFRDTDFLLDATGVGATCSKLGVRFVDLNLDEIDGIDNPHGLTRLKHFYLPKTILDAGAIISLPKMKTHHWVGMTASMKNLFGTVPGRKYGWPKNILHWLGISLSIVDLQHLVKPTFGIVDGIVAMEGDGPINGRAKPIGLLALGTDLAALDATCARAMTIDPLKLPYLKLANEAVGNVEESRIKVLGETVKSVCMEFEMAPNFKKDKKAAQAKLEGI